MTTFFILYGPFGDIVHTTESPKAAGFVHRTIQDNRCVPITPAKAKAFLQSLNPSRTYRLSSNGAITEAPFVDPHVVSLAEKCKLLDFGLQFLDRSLSDFQARFSYTESVNFDLDLCMFDRDRYVQGYADATGLPIEVAAKQVAFDLESVLQVRHKAAWYRAKYLSTLRSVAKQSDLESWTRLLNTELHDIGKL